MMENMNRRNRYVLFSSEIEQIKLFHMVFEKTCFKKVSSD